MKETCQNCGKPLEDSFLTDCSNKCQFETYLKSQPSSLTPKTEANPTLVKPSSFFISKFSFFPK